jgi:hypothetical protein
MSYALARVTLEVYEQELESLTRLLLMDLEGNEDLLNSIVFSPPQEGWRLSPAELLRKGLFKEAYEAAKSNFFQLQKKEAIQLSRSPRLHQRSSQSRGRN